MSPRDSGSALTGSASAFSATERSTGEALPDSSAEPAQIVSGERPQRSVGKRPPPARSTLFALIGLQDLDEDEPAVACDVHPHDHNEMEEP